MCCRGKSSGRTGVCAREMGREREGDRQRERQHGESERQPDSCPLGELGLFFELLSDSFLSSQTLPYPPLYFSQSSPMCFLWALAAGICLPACPLTPSFSLFLTLFFALCRSLEACGPYFPSSLLVSASPDLSLSLTLTHLRSSLPGRLAHQLFVVQFTLLQQIQNVLLLHANTNRKTQGR